MREQLINSYRDKLKNAIGLAETLGASAVKITFSHNESQGVSFENSRLKNINNSDSISYGISVIVDGHGGFAAGNQPEDLETIARRAVTLAKIGSKEYFTKYPQPADFYPSFVQYDANIQKFSCETMIADCQELIDFMKSRDSSLVAEAGACRGEAESILMNNEGLELENISSSWSIDAGFQKTSGTDMLNTGAWRSGCILNSLYDLQFIKNSLDNDLKNASRQATLPSGKYPLIIPPQFLRRFLSPVFMGINGRNVFKGVSPLKDKIGQCIFSSELTIEDNPHIDGRGESEGSDSAGIQTKRQLLVEHGRLNAFLYDYDTACLAQTTPTGNDDCAPYNPIVLPGNTSSEDIFKNVKQGIFIKQLLGFGQSNLINGDFSANVELGFVVENGEITGRIKNAMISGNILEMLNQPLIISSDTDPQTLQPTILLPQVNFIA